MKSTLNANGIYVNCKVTEIPKDDTHKVFVKVANCDDGYRCSVGFLWNTYNKQSMVAINSKPYSSERESITSELNKTIKSIIDRVGVELHADLLYFMKAISEEYSQLEIE